MEKKWPFVFNGIVIFCLILLILGMRWQAKKEESEVLNVTESLQKESEITSFSEEEEAVLYMLSALKKNDLDMALRGCAIDETALQINFVKTAEDAAYRSAGSNIRLFVLFSAYIGRNDQSIY